MIIINNVVNRIGILSFLKLFYFNFLFIYFYQQLWSFTFALMNNLQIYFGWCHCNTFATENKNVNFGVLLLWVWGYILNYRYLLSLIIFQLFINCWKWFKWLFLFLKNFSNPELFVKWDFYSLTFQNKYVALALFISSKYKSL